MEIRYATPDDAKAIAEVEAECFPAAEAASLASIENRLQYYANHFWLLEDNGRLIGFANGMVSNEDHLLDVMFDHGEMHDENGKWQLIFGLDTIPEYRCRGCGEVLLNSAIEDARKQNRMGLILTCKEQLIHYYEKFGFVKEGLSNSTHGKAVWYDMRLTF